MSTSCVCASRCIPLTVLAAAAIWTSSARPAFATGFWDQGGDQTSVLDTGFSMNSPDASNGYGSSSSSGGYGTSVANTSANCTAHDTHDNAPPGPYFHAPAGTSQERITVYQGYFWLGLDTPTSSFTAAFSGTQRVTLTGGSQASGTSAIYIDAADQSSISGGTGSFNPTPTISVTGGLNYAYPTAILTATSAAGGAQDGTFESDSVTTGSWGAVQ